MADPIDPTSQKRDAGTKEQLTQRQRVDTYTDPGRYNMPPRRKLGVEARVVDKTVAPVTTGLEKLASSLAAVKPQLMNYLNNKQVEKNQQDIEFGIQEAMKEIAFQNDDTKFVDDQWKRFGYEQRKALMMGEQIGQELETAVGRKDAELDYDEWYNNWWKETNEKYPQIAGLNTEHLDTFNRGLQDSVLKAKNIDIIAKDKLEQEAWKANAIEFVRKDIKEQLAEGRVTDALYLDALRNELMTMDRYTGQEASDYILEAITAIVKDPEFDTKDQIEILRMLDTRRGPEKQLPSYADTNTTVVNQLKEEMVRAVQAKIKAEQARQTKLDSELKDFMSTKEAQLVAEVGITLNIVEKALGEDKAVKQAINANLVKENFLKNRNFLKQYVYSGDLTPQEASDKAYEMTYSWAIENQFINEQAVAYKKEQDDKQKVDDIWFEGYRTSGGGLVYEAKSAEVYEVLQNGGDPSTVIERWNTLPDHIKTQIELDGRFNGVKMEKEAINKKLEARRNNIEAAKDLRFTVDKEGKIVPNFNNMIVENENERTAIVEEINKQVEVINNGSEEERNQFIEYQQIKERQRLQQEEQKRNTDRGWTQQYIMNIKQWHQDGDLSVKVSNVDNTVEVDPYKEWREENRPAYETGWEEGFFTKIGAEIKEAFSSFFTKEQSKSPWLQDPVSTQMFYSDIEKEYNQLYTEMVTRDPKLANPNFRETAPGGRMWSKAMRAVNKRYKDNPAIWQTTVKEEQGPDAEQPKKKVMNNPANLKTADGKSFRSFTTLNEAHKAYAEQLVRYFQGTGVAEGRKAKTIRDVVNLWRPASDRRGAKDISQENYVKIVSETVGYDADTPLNVMTKDPKVIAKMIQAITRVEGSEQPYESIYLALTTQ